MNGETENGKMAKVGVWDEMLQQQHLCGNPITWPGRKTSESKPDELK